MGGLVARYYMGCLGGADAVERAIFLGTPHRGSVRSLVIALADERQRPFGFALGKLHVILQGLPSLYQLLPVEPVADLEDGSPFDLFEQPDSLTPACRKHLESAAALRTELAGAEAGAVAVTSVFGYGRRTLARLRLRRKPLGGVEIAEEEFVYAGDGTVLERSATLDGAEIHPVEQEHGALHADRDVLRRIRFELTER
jgi:hypothetical protein